MHAEYVSVVYRGPLFLESVGCPQGLSLFPVIFSDKTKKCFFNLWALNSLSSKRQGLDAGESVQLVRLYVFLQCREA